MQFVVGYANVNVWVAVVLALTH